MESRVATFVAAVVFTLFSWAHSGKVVCYFGSWAYNRNGDGKCDIEDIDPNLCTHLLYGFLGLNPSTNEIKLLDSKNDLQENGGNGAFNRFNALRSKNRNLKTMVSIGGWNEGSVSYSNMVANSKNRETFISSAVKFLQTYKFDGLDIDWEYPANRGGSPKDKQNFALLLKEMRTQFNKHNYLLSAAVSGNKPVIDSAYDVPALSKYLDFINVMAYDYHVCSEPVTGHYSPLYDRPNESAKQKNLNTNFSVNYFISKGAAPGKLIMGVGMYGNTFTLANANNHGICDPAMGPGQAGPYIEQSGMLGYNEICMKLKSGSWTVITDPHYKTPYAYCDDQWVGYDNEASVLTKCNYAKSKGLGGVMIWSIDSEDCHGLCGKKFPLLSIISNAICG